jgi:ribonuclease HII
MRTAMIRPVPGTRLIAGVDEVGRGPLAGPVVAAAVILLRPIEGLADSKLLDAPTRERLAHGLREVALIAVAAASVTEIDRINILHASMLAMRRAVLRLGCLPDVALIDGNRAPDLPCAVETVVDGDRDVPVIGAASIVAKVTRDRLMRRLALRYPGYGWESNVGYATPVHRDAVRRLGATCHHRRSFCTVQAALF